jgi:hypothetical protein
MVHRVLVSAVVAVVLGSGLVATAGSAGATPISLTVPQGVGFALLGHSCGGIQEKSYANGFAPVTGWPVGDVYLSTRCGGSGRGGGGGTTTYAAWVAATWDFTAALVSDSQLGTPPVVDPTLTAFDAHGNEVYNQSNSAFLVLAASFVAPARVAGVSPAAAPGKTVLTVTGTGFTGTTSVWFGPTAAHFTVLNDSTMFTTAPATGIGRVNVRVINGGGVSPKVPADQFTFTLAPNVLGLSPNQGTADGGTSVTITGVNLANATSVLFGGVPATITSDGPSSMSVTSPAGPDSGVVVAVTVTTPLGTSALRPSDRYTYT